VAALIAAQSAGHGIPAAVACRALGVSRSWFYKWKTGGRGSRAVRRQRLTAEVARLFALHEGKYGSPRITADLREAGWRVSENTIAALMREQGLAARQKKRRRSATRPGKGRWRAPDLVRRDFPASQLNRKWYGDGTEIPTGEGKLYLDSVLDMASRRVLGFALGEHHNAELAYGALTIAVAVRGGQVPGVILHTDQGSEAGLKGSSQHRLLLTGLTVARRAPRRVSSSRVSCVAGRSARLPRRPGRRGCGG
jgi:putative transposase